MSRQVPVLLVGMIITGSSNILWTKFQDMQCVENCGDPDPRNHVLYQQPVLQTLQMFLGEMLCLLPVLYIWLNARRTPPVALLPLDPDTNPQTKLSSQHLRGFKLLLLWVPAACDLTASTLMNIVLLYTPVSIFQMSRGALVLSTGILSVIFLRRRLWLYQWIALFVVVAGLSLVGYSGSLLNNASGNAVNPAAARLAGNTDRVDAINALFGVFLMLFAQLILAGQFVLEERIMARWNVDPLVVAGFEGLFGVLTLVSLMPLLAHPSVSARSPLFDLERGWRQRTHTPGVFWPGFVIILGTGLFNYFGLGVTRRVGATTRCLADACKTLAIWSVSLVLGWERLSFPVSLLQVLGFSLLVYGTLLYNDLVRPPSFLLPSPSPTTAIEPATASGAAET